MEKIPIMSKHKLEIKDLFDEKGELKLNIQKNQGLITFAEGVFQYVISPEDLNEDLIRHLSQLVQTTNLYHAEKIRRNSIIDDAFLKLYHPTSPSPPNRSLLEQMKDFTSLKHVTLLQWHVSVIRYLNDQFIHFMKERYPTMNDDMIESKLKRLDWNNQKIQEKKYIDYIKKHVAGEDIFKVLKYASTAEKVKLLQHSSELVTQDKLFRFLISIIFMEDEVCIQAIGSSNFDLNIKDELHGSLLHYAIENKKEAISLLLLEYIDDTHHVNALSQTPLMLAIEHMQINTIKKLLLKEVNLEGEDVWGKTVLMYLCKSKIKETSIIVPIIEHANLHCSIDSIDKKDRQTALFFAIQNNHLALVQCLLIAGADPNFCIRYPLIPIEGSINIMVSVILLLQVIAYFLNTETPRFQIVMIMSHWAILYSIYFEGCTPLVYCEKLQNMEAFKILIENGASISSGIPFHKNSLIWRLAEQYRHDNDHIRLMDLVTYIEDYVQDSSIYEHINDYNDFFERFHYNETYHPKSM